MTRNYQNKYFSILGDSISTLAGYNPPECAVFYDWEHKLLAGIYAPEDTWWGKVIDALGGRLLVNNAYSGSTVCKHPDCEIESYGCSDARTGGLGIGELAPDVVMILLGLNDFGCGMPVDGENGLSVFSVAYETMLAKIQKNYPQAEVWCLTLPRSHWSRNPYFEIPAYRSGGHISDYCRAIRVCAEKAGCKVVDIYRPSEPYDTIDGYHPTANGMQTIADAVLREIEGGGTNDH